MRLQVPGGGNAAIHIEGSVAVGNRAMLYLVRVGDTQLVAGTDLSGFEIADCDSRVIKEVLDARSRTWNLFCRFRARLP